jgi:hypothetical protein
MALKDVVEKEARKIREIALWAVVELKLECKVRDLVDAIYQEHEWWISHQPLNQAQETRFRCLEALGVILDPATIGETAVADWIKMVDRAVRTLRRDVVKAAPAPDPKTFRAWKRRQRKEAQRFAKKYKIAA